MTVLQGPRYQLISGDWAVEHASYLWRR